MSLDAELRAWAEEERRAPPPSPEASQALVAAARAQQGPASSSTRWLGVVGVALAAAMLLFVLLPTTPTAPPPLVTGVNQLGADQVTLSAGARAEVVTRGPQTLIALEAGALEAEVAPRVEGERFSVRAGEYEVRVIGTAFTVERDPFAVEVREGVVEVLGENILEPVRVRAGERFPPTPEPPTEPLPEPLPDPLPEPLSEPEALAPPPEPPPAKATPPAPGVPSVDELTRRLLQGEREAVREELRLRVEQEPDDLKAWLLLAQLETRSDAVPEAVYAWRRIIELGSPSEAQRARYQAARLLTHRPDEAEALLRRFLEEPDPLAAEARLRLAQVIYAQQRDAEAERELHTLISDHPGTTPARQAAALLKEIEEDRER